MSNSNSSSNMDVGFVNMKNNKKIKMEIRK